MKLNQRIPVKQKSSSDLHDVKKDIYGIKFKIFSDSMVYYCSTYFQLSFCFAVLNKLSLCLLLSATISSTFLLG